MESPFRADLLSGKAALVTGGGSGISFEIAMQLSRHGAHVALMGCRREVLDKAITTVRSEGLTKTQGTREAAADNHHFWLRPERTSAEIAIVLTYATGYMNLPVRVSAMYQDFLEA